MEDEREEAEKELSRLRNNRMTKNDRLNKIDCVYVIGMGQYVKIGYTTTSIETRLKCMKVSMPEDPTIYATIAGSRADESALHKRFSIHRSNREWFYLEGSLEEWISEGCPYESVSLRARVNQARSSAVERGPYTAVAAGSNPAAPTT